jgi:hypothetical protein
LSSVLSRGAPIVVEDCAHAPFTCAPNGEALGEKAPLCLYSLNKFLPVGDGAILVSHRPDIDLSIDEEALPELPMRAQQAYLSHLDAGRSLVTSDDPVQAKTHLERLGITYEDYYAVINAELGPCRQSARSRRIEQTFPYRQLTRQRVLNSLIVYRELNSPTFSLVYPSLPPGTVPFCIPARVPALRRAAILQRLFEQGILLSTLQDKWDFIPVGRREHFAVEAAFLDEHVLIPVSEFIEAEAMHSMVELLNGISTDDDNDHAKFPG